jgi:dihydroorotase
VPAVKQGFIPDSISTDLHVDSMNAGMKDMTNVMSKFLNLGMSVDDVILRSTWNPAREIRREQYGHLTPGAVGDVAVFRLMKGDFGFLDARGSRLRGTQKLVAELTIKGGRVVWDLNGLAAEDWDKVPASGQLAQAAKPLHLCVLPSSFQTRHTGGSRSLRHAAELR